MDDLRIKYIKAISEAKDENALEDVPFASLKKDLLLYSILYKSKIIYSCGLNLSPIQAALGAPTP